MGLLLFCAWIRSTDVHGVGVWILLIISICIEIKQIISLSLPMDRGINHIHYLTNKKQSLLTHNHSPILSRMPTPLEFHMVRDPSEEQKFREYVDETEKDRERYMQIKEKMKSQYFKIKSHRKTSGLGHPPQLQIFTQQTSKHEPVLEEICTYRSYNPSKPSDVERELQAILAKSQVLTRSKIRRPKVKTITEKAKQTKKIHEQEKNLIKQFVRKNSTDHGTRQWEQLSSSEKYMMNFSDYLRKKTKAAIETDVYDMKIKPRTTEIEKFQDFILEEVHFSADHREKLSHFFKQIRAQVQKSNGDNHRYKSTEFSKGLYTPQKRSTRK